MCRAGLSLARTYRYLEFSPVEGQPDELVAQLIAEIERLEREANAAYERGWDAAEAGVEGP
jgi:hypothetical protein